MSNKFIERVKRTIEKYNMLAKEDTVLVGVSGGPDSVALLYILNLLKEQYALKLYVAHVNHMFRGEEANKEAQFVAKLAADWGIDYEIYERDVPALAKAKGLSPEDAGHKVRKKIYEELREKIGAKKLALGHHADDRAETVLLHLVQGTGLDGLASMPPKYGWIIRPLAEVSKKDIANFCKENNLLYCLDPSNAKPVYLRNKIRLNLLPYLKEELNPQIVETLLKLENIVIEENNYVEEQVDNVFQQVLKKHEKDKLILHLKEFREQHIAIQRRIVRKVYKILRPWLQNLGYTHVEQVINISKANEGFKELNLPDQILVKKNYTSLEFWDLEKHKENAANKFDSYFNWHIPGNLNLPLQQIILKSYYTETIPETGKDYNKIVVDASKIQSPLVVRKRQPGDRIQPLGMSGSKKLKDFFIDRKVDKNQRDLIPVVCSGNDIIWLPGLMMSEIFKVTSRTKYYLNLEMVKDEYV